MSKRRNKKNKKNKTIVGAICTLIVLVLMIANSNTEVSDKLKSAVDLNNIFENEQEETVATSTVEFVTDDNLRVYFIDVGQADSILVINGNESMLIDAGNNEDGETVVNFIKDKGIEKLNYVIRNTSA
jgi:competence protein ComEC